MSSSEERPTSSEGRIVENEVTLRRVNEAIETGRRVRDSGIPFVCECGMVGCNEVVELSIGEYEQVRRHGNRFIVAPGHQTDVDDAVIATDRYEVVSKREGAPAERAEETDPRAGDTG